MRLLVALPCNGGVKLYYKRAVANSSSTGSCPIVSLSLLPLVDQIDLVIYTILNYTDVLVFSGGPSRCWRGPGLGVRGRRAPRGRRAGGSGRPASCASAVLSWSSSVRVRVHGRGPGGRGSGRALLMLAAQNWGRFRIAPSASPRLLPLQCTRPVPSRPVLFRPRRRPNLD